MQHDAPVIRSTHLHSFKALSAADGAFRMPARPAAARVAELRGDPEMTKPADAGQNPDEQAILDFLLSKPQRTGMPSPTWMPRRRPVTSPEDIARQNGLDGLAEDIQRLRRGRTVPRPRPQDRGRRHQRRSSRPQPDREAQFVRVLLTLAPARTNIQIAGWARSWSRLPIEATELHEWVQALGAEGAAAARTWLERGLGLTALETMVDGQPAGRRVRSGEAVDSVLARAWQSGIHLGTGD
jgi:hypothetical protein